MRCSTFVRSAWRIYREVAELIKRAGDVLADPNLECVVNRVRPIDHVIVGPLSLGSRFARD